MQIATWSLPEGNRFPSVWRCLGIIFVPHAAVVAVLRLRLWLANVVFTNSMVLKLLLSKFVVSYSLLLGWFSVKLRVTIRVWQDLLNHCGQRQKQFLFAANSVTIRKYNYVHIISYDSIANTSPTHNQASKIRLLLLSCNKCEDLNLLRDQLPRIQSDQDRLSRHPVSHLNSQWIWVNA